MYFRFYKLHWGQKNPSISRKRFLQRFRRGIFRRGQFLVTRAFRSVPMTGRFPGFRVITAPRLLTFAMALCGTILRFTVTRSYRICTCFPFTPRHPVCASGAPIMLRIQFFLIVARPPQNAIAFCAHFLPLPVQIHKSTIMLSKTHMRKKEKALHYDRYPGAVAV